jgi:hypothetical protein
MELSQSRIESRRLLYSASLENPDSARSEPALESQEKFRAQLTEDLRKLEATWATERERAIARLGQAFCDVAVQAWLLSEITGERIPVPAERWSTKEGAAALRSGGYTLITAMSIIKGTVVVLAADLDRWLASGAASQMPSAPWVRGPKSHKRDPTVDRMVQDYAGRQAALEEELEKTLKEMYGVSRTTAREARKIALLKLRQTPT